MLLTTQDAIRTLQWKLYAKAKQETVFCYALNVECAGAISSVVLTNVGRENAHASA